MTEMGAKGLLTTCRESNPPETRTGKSLAECFVLVELALLFLS